MHLHRVEERMNEQTAVHVLVSFAHPIAVAIFTIVSSPCVSLDELNAALDSSMPHRL